MKIEFIAETKEMLGVLEKPYPAINKLPDWFCITPSYIGGEKSVSNGDPMETVKKCMPFFDAMTAGYHIPLHTDVWVDSKGTNDFKIHWAWDTIDVVSTHDIAQFDKLQLPYGVHPTGFKFINPWIVKTPPGWSCLFIHPIHQDKLPFTTLTGIVDTDKHPTPTNIIFSLDSSFRGLIPKGTPYVQVIPFKREKFKSEFGFDSGFFKQQWIKAHSVFFDRYKRFFRSPKVYEQGEVKKCPFHFKG